jgi:hypothetical protein
MSNYLHVRHAGPGRRERHYLVRKGIGIASDVVIAEATSEYAMRLLLADLKELDELRRRASANRTSMAAE